MKKINLVFGFLLMFYLSWPNAISAEMQIVNEGSEPDQVITPKSKQGGEALKGTWFLIYTYPENTDIKQDRMVIDSLTDKLVVSGDIAAKGKYYVNQSGEGKTIICLDYRPETSPNLYTCVTQTIDNKFVSFDFSLVKNSESLFYLTDGKFGVGDTFDQSRIALMSNTYRMTGYLESESTDAVYNESNEELDIPAVNYKGVQYRVIFQVDQDEENNQGILTYTLKEAMPLLSQLKVEAKYNEIEKELEIPVVIYQGSRYRVVLEEDDDVALKFKLKEAFLIADFSTFL